jgi:OOP family OmpA-OmpF porin
MKRILTMLALSVALSPLPAMAQPFQLYEGVAAVRGQSVPNDGFEHSLANEYRRLALFEADDMVDWIDAERFAQKTLASARGETVEPERLEDWKLGEAQLPALKSSRHRLLRAFERDARILAPHASARAQAQFDCWVEQAEEGHQTEHIAACREGFLDAMLEIDAALANYALERIERDYPAK